MLSKSSLNLLRFSFKLFPWVPCHHWIAGRRDHQLLLQFPSGKWSHPSVSFSPDKSRFPSSCSKDFPSSPFTSFVAQFWMHSRMFTLFLNCEAQNAHSTQDEAVPILNSAGRALLLTGCSCCVWCTPGWDLLSWLPEHMLLAPPELLSTSSPTSLSTRLLSSHSFPSLYLCLVFLCLKYGIQYF